MKFRSAFLGALLSLATLGAPRAEFVETPALEPLVAAGKLPPVAARLPQAPRVIDLSGEGRGPGQPGGSMRMLMGDQRDIRMMTIYGYTRLVVFNDKLELAPDLLEGYEVEEGRIFTLRLRRGHKWSDGSPFTTEDFRYYWEDVANNERLSPGGPPPTMLPNGRKPRVEIIDAQTIRYSWDSPNPSFIPALAGTQPLYIYMASKYLKQFHPRYADPTKLAEAIKALRVRDWASLHERKSRSYRPENPELPMLDPWVPRTTPPAELFVFERNPYFHRVDTNGRQLPYVDTVRLSTGTGSLIPAKVGSGESDLQAQYLRFDNYTFLKDGEQRNNYRVRLWQMARGAFASLIPNQNAGDPVWRALVRDVRFRRALSIAINRHDINQVIFYGLANESADTVLPQSPLYKPEYAKAWAQYDPQGAKRLLDEIGLRKHDIDGIRLLPDGRRAEIIVETAGESTEETDILELVADDLRRVGIRILTHSSNRDIFRRKIMSGQVVMSVWPGLDNALPSADMEPDALAPSNQAQLQWPLWGLNVISNGEKGEAPTSPEAKELVALLGSWRHSATHEERVRIWTRMLDIHADQVFTIGIVGGTAQPVVVSNQLRNVPEKGNYSFEPGAYFGMYMPDTFWFDKPVAAN